MGSSIEVVSLARKMGEVVVVVGWVGVCVCGELR